MATQRSKALGVGVGVGVGVGMSMDMVMVLDPERLRRETGALEATGVREGDGSKKNTITRTWYSKEHWNTHFGLFCCSFGVLSLLLALSHSLPL